jgi:hypothetical protein
MCLHNKLSLLAPHVNFIMKWVRWSEEALNTVCKSITTFEMFRHRCNLYCRKNKLQNTYFERGLVKIPCFTSQKGILSLLLGRQTKISFYLICKFAWFWNAFLRGLVQLNSRCVPFALDIINYRSITWCVLLKWY